MSENHHDLFIAPLKHGLILALLTLCTGMALGGLFGVREDGIKEYFKTGAETAVATHGDADKAAADAWKYLKRAHEHYMGLGAVSLALIFLVGFSPAKKGVKRILSRGIGAGAFLYPSFWLLTSLKTPHVGSHAAKNSLPALLMAHSSAGLCILSLASMFVVFVCWAFCSGRPAGLFEPREMN